MNGRSKRMNERSKRMNERADEQIAQFLSRRYHAISTLSALAEEKKKKEEEEEEDEERKRNEKDWSNENDVTPKMRVRAYRVKDHVSRVIEKV